MKRGTNRGIVLVMDETPKLQMVPYTEVRYVTMGCLTIYLLSEDDLRMIARGSPSSTYLNLAIFFLSVGASFWVSLALTAQIRLYTYIAVVIVIVGALIAGFVLGVLWLRSAGDAKATIQRIRERGIAPSTNPLSENPANQP